MSFRDRLAFDPSAGRYQDGAIRYMMIRPDAFMGILHELPEARRPEVLEAMARSITKQGGKSARSYQAMGAQAPAALLSVIAETAPQLGWGIWAFSELHGEGFQLGVRGSPFAEGFGAADHPVCAPISGMLQAIGPMVLGGPVQAVETECAAMGAAECQFQVARVRDQEPGA